MSEIINNLPHGAELERRLQTLAALDAVYCPEWADRAYSFNGTWAPDERMGSMRNGSGDGFFALFADGRPAMLRCYGEGCADGPVEATDDALRPLVDEPAFSNEIKTEFFLLDEGTTWRVTGSPTEYGLRELLGTVAGQPEDYAEFADDMYEPESYDEDAIEDAFDAPRVTPELAARINADADPDQLREDLARIYG